VTPLFAQAFRLQRFRCGPSMCVTPASAQP
jgi:hypothetical protein